MLVGWCFSLFFLFYLLMRDRVVLFLSLRFLTFHVAQNIAFLLGMEKRVDNLNKIDLNICINISGCVMCAVWVSVSMCTCLGCVGNRDKILIIPRYLNVCASVQDIVPTCVRFSVDVDTSVSLPLKLKRNFYTW